MSGRLLLMVSDTNVVIAHLRRQEFLPARAILSVIVVGELKAFALKADWGFQKVTFLQRIFERCPLISVGPELTGLYARLDAWPAIATRAECAQRGQK